MIRKGIYILGILIFLTTSLVFVGCEKDKGLYVGFEFCSGCDDSLPDYCAYRSDVSEFDINDVTLEFYYGCVFSYSLEDELENGRNIGKAKLYFISPGLCKNSNCETRSDYFGQIRCGNPLCEEKRFFIKEGEEDYTSEAHRWKFDSYKEGEGDTITIPKELFVGEKGELFFAIYGKNKNDPTYPNNEYEWLSGKGIRYVVIGDRVKLSG